MKPKIINHPCKVSVSIITYNQVDYIDKAIDSALNQEVNFSYEIIIGDDYSTDGTREILLDYKKKYPDLIKLNLQDDHDEEGIAGRRNNITNIRSARGEYIAFLDGDDYWIGRDKLQRQADFMDAHPEFTLCCADALDIYKERNERSFRSDNFRSMQTSCVFDYRMVIKMKLPIITSSTFFRKKYIIPLPHWFKEVYLADFCLQLLALSHGPGKYFQNIKVGKVWIKNSMASQYLSGRSWIETRKNDNILITENFKNQQALPYSYKSMFYMKSVMRFKREKHYFKMLLALYKVYRYDDTYLIHWLKSSKNITEGSYKKTFLTFIIKGIQLTMSCRNTFIRTT